MTQLKDVKTFVSILFIRYYTKEDFWKKKYSKTPKNVKYFILIFQLEVFTGLVVENINARCVLKDASG